MGVAGEPLVSGEAPARADLVGGFEQAVHQAAQIAAGDAERLDLERLRRRSG